MQNLFEKFPKLKNSYTLIKVALSGYIILGLFDSLFLLSDSKIDQPFLMFIPLVTLALIMLFGVLKEYRWAELLTMLYIIGAFYLYIHTIINGFANTDNSTVVTIIRYFIIASSAILSFVIFVLIFIVRFNRSKEMTDSFVKYQ